MSFPVFNLRRCTRLLFGAGLLSASLTAYALPAGMSKGPSVEGVTQYTMKNGLRIVLAPDDSKPTTTVNMTYLVGSRHENYGQTGMAHLLEHMMFRGTPTLRNALGEFSKRGLQANGTTSSDRTNYYASFASNPSELEWYLGWQADIMANALIDKQDLQAEMPVVRNEMEEGENNPFRILMQRLTAISYQWHNYGKSTIGARSDVENVDVEQLRNFYHEYYQPDNAVLFVTGEFDTDQTLAVIDKAFGAIPKPNRTLPPEYTVEPVQDGTRTVELRRQGGTPLIMSSYHIPSSASPDYIPLSLGVGILGDTPSGPLYKNLVDTKLATGVFAYDSDNYAPGYALFGAQLNADMDVKAAEEALNRTLETLSEHPLSEADLDRIRSKWLVAWNKAYANSASLANALSDAAANGDWRLFFLHRDRVEATTLPQVQQALETWLVASNRSTGVYLPTEKPVRAPVAVTPDIATLLADYQGKGNTAAIEAFDPSPANIDARTDRTPLTLSGDAGKVDLALLPKATRGQRVEARLQINFGQAAQFKDKAAIASATASLLEHGTNTLSRQEIDDKFTALQTQYSFSGEGGTLNISLSSTHEHLPQALALSLQVLREANFPEDELAKYKQAAIAAITQSSTDPSTLAYYALERYRNPWPKGDIRYTPTFEESIAAIQALERPQLQAFQQEFYGTGNIAFSAVGDFDPEQVRTVLKQGLDNWKPAPAYQRIETPYHAMPAKQIITNTPDKANAFYLANLQFPLQDTNPDFAPLYLANYLLGLSETSRLWNKVRVEDGLSYNVRSTLDASSYEPDASWDIYAIHAPDNSAKLETTIQSILATTLKEGFSDQEVKEGAKALINYRKLSRSQDRVLSRVWINYLEQGRTFQWSQDIDDQLLKLDAKTVNDALRKYLKPEDMVISIAADESKQ
ncbi:M16 family metallopeptidase [Alcaligenes endophyticus]|uniref:Insulinase family protein n=1 Tax=Alcaligenes endophyticus TaxID=1929088 RepID=A0ABT8EHC5_9BURK|nr:pitrilysin family protein [Alcaligenes endophyticus]MCX5589650.1 pitrilysin family protein [Alcaligenes endophyticus]MDN4120686.1 insulinase family protein [Alcaligenes endophyticus]